MHPYETWEQKTVLLDVIYNRSGPCLSKKMWLSAAPLLTMVLTLLEVFILGHWK